MVIDYVGGRAALDVTIAKALKQPGGRCWLAAGRDVAGTAKDVLQGPDSANWRRCYDRRTGTNVSCGVLHSGEYLAAGNLLRATDVECQVAAATYLDQNPGNLLEDLEVRPLPVESGNPDTARCIPRLPTGPDLLAVGTQSR
ncbi:hypothetical protein EV643_12163 [Kribbella sp. VKM Ac-2527]|uniref:Uncharacterized protein n=1 Tax=Kribbella caucasensis TaxID=2512215 RepID=A0A4R6JKN1_9ACTN|nr:hypothetical protein [Kribbella sp. VKM Ac-2527]TDO35791.1 hypothetical protein EV643_12163 [Kribbella sp. VKM Ac-2527]